MKLFSVFSIAAALIVVGCATQRKVATLEGSGTSRTYAADFDQVWRAAVDAAQQDGLQVMNADRDHGYIAARRTVQPHTFGENVGIWVRQTGPSATEAEVVSRQAGPPVLWLKNWENEIQRAIAANLTREAAAVGGAPRQVIIEQGSASSTAVVPRAGEAVVIPPSSSTHEALREEQRQIESLRMKQQTGERALANEVDQTKREMLQREVDRLHDEIRIQENRLRDLERELK